ncbi:hypothetical protein R3W88_004279 [Solanum pinnatisectum]|uniref:G-patch domain-containing protein n=1 Tax=Solanum pinnatisectum TaxID=50273 RepID=A0AAV9K8T7_9SOLN|nr:hypothetical protein R3W88_004279 [Solanum pinnatisectum]
MQVVRVNEEVEPANTKLSSAASMVASEMLKYGCQPKSGIGPKGTNRLRYEPTLGRVHHGSSKTIFIPEQALITDQAGVDDIVEGICNLFVAMAREEEEINLSKLTIRDAEPREIMQNWTISPSLLQPKSW